MLEKVKSISFNFLRKKFFLLTLLLLPFVLFIFGKNSYSSNYNISWNSGNLNLYGTLLIPKNGAKSVAILIPGSGNIGRKTAWYKHQAEELVKKGLAVFYYDKRGVGESEGDWKNSNFNDYARDAVSAIPQIKKLFRNKKLKIGFVGYSQGSWVMMECKKLYPETAFLINVSGPIRSAEEQGRFITRNKLKNLGYDSAVINTVDQLQKMISNVYRTDSGWDEAKRKILKYSNENWFKDADLYLQPRDSWNWKWYAQLPFDYDPNPELAQITIPYLNVQGGKDPLTDGARNIRITDLLKEKGLPTDSYFDEEGTHLCRYKKKYLIFWDESYWKPEYWIFLHQWLNKYDIV